MPAAWGLRNRWNKKFHPRSQGVKYGEKTVWIWKKDKKTKIDDLNDLVQPITVVQKCVILVVT